MPENTRTARETVELMMHTIVHGGRDALADLYAPDVVITNPFAPDGVPVSVTGNEELRTRMKAYEQLWSYDAVEDVTIHETADPEVVVVEFGDPWPDHRVRQGARPTIRQRDADRRRPGHRVARLQRRRPRGRVVRRDPGRSGLVAPRSTRRCRPATTTTAPETRPRGLSTCQYTVSVRVSTPRARSPRPAG